MPDFDIVKNSEITKTYRVARIMGDFDVKTEHAGERFRGTIELPENWSVGLIYGASGTGKTTIARTVWGGQYFSPEKIRHDNASVIDDMPKTASVDEIEKMFYAVGFGSVPSWIKPYNVLSTGEKMRVDLAYSLLNSDQVVFDEYTSVVDRNVARVCSMALQKAVRKNKKQFIAVSCHSDIIEWLEPDWTFCTDNMKMSFPLAHAPNSCSDGENVGVNYGRSSGVIII